MYVPSHFAAKDEAALIDRLARQSAALLVTVGEHGQPIATHLPVLWDGETHTITSHIARANPHWKLGAGEGLIVLSGADAYVSPHFYPSKAEHGKAVPTWNYEAVHLSGAVTWFEDAARLEDVVRRLSERHEGARAKPWRIEDAPRSYIDGLLRGIIGVEMHVKRVEAKQKLSQNKSAADFEGVRRGLMASSPPAQEVGVAMGRLRDEGN